MPDDYSSPRWQRLRLEILERDGYKCQIRGPKCKGKANEVDHIVPVADGGPMFEPTNCRAACNWCNTWRAQRQKSRDGWKRASTRITLVMGPPGSCEELAAAVAERARPGDLVIDYRSLAGAIGDRPEEVRKVRGSLLTKLRRGEVDAARAWITSTNPAAGTKFPYHEVLVIDPGREHALAHMPAAGAGLVDDWYTTRAAGTAPGGPRDW